MDRPRHRDGRARGQHHRARYPRRAADPALRRPDSRRRHRQRRTYAERLAQGHGYDETHRQILGDVQTDERRARNADHGYWIAEADSHAGHHAEIRHHEPAELGWAVLATDGAQRAVDHLHLSWDDIGRKDDAELLALLQDLHRWEVEQDPDGRLLPRAKRHDGKTIAAWVPEQK